MHTVFKFLTPAICFKIFSILKLYGNNYNLHLI